ncbi:FMN-binding glutamate synthase family protein [Nocardioides sp. ChNu-153]|uniref:FMN-binding glutamate synthase family protein n=1 Tax=unclassified Nocardioides TaxID=2615069 RepID=UPI00240517FE|nr:MULTISPECIES: FMN-binding glutamate synthase family protein [unclassified Nocardioides]MDF9716061.1 FMN-binding glutamate synthase family protein [Nocardioides sp. ChNu-99]MDN7120337.1 FMN-binding glutamate synthase family protein [Nocardioides sp. ChNu-153]
MRWTSLAGLGAAAVGALAVRDATQKKHAILRNYPVVGHGRFLVERFGPELRQYIVTSNDEERPFSRDQRRWVYASSKLENAYVGFGTDNDVENTAGYPVVKHRTFAGSGPGTHPHSEEGVPLPGLKVLGGPRGRRHAFVPPSIVNVSGMSFGSLSHAAITALNQGVATAGAWQNTGEGGLSTYHRAGGDLVFQIGTAYFGCRDAEGRFDLARLVDLVASAPVRAIEIKLSQGAKPGLGGLLPGAKVTPEIAEVRGIPVGVDCASPSRHTAFDSVDSMLDLVERVADATGLPVGIKSAVGNLDFWDELVAQMASGERGVDFVNIDGGEGGTGAAPLIFSDAVAYPFRIGFAEVRKRFDAAGLGDRVTFLGAGKLGIPENAVVAFALGVDVISVGREAMLALGCIQAQKCHTDRCPVGVATQDPRYVRGLDVPSKAERVTNYLVSLRRDLLKVAEAVGVDHPALITVDDIDVLDGVTTRRSLRDVYGY